MAYAQPTPTLLLHLQTLQGRETRSVSAEAAGHPLPEADLPFSQRYEHGVFQLHEHLEGFIHVAVGKAFSCICNYHTVRVGRVDVVKF